MSDDRRRPAPRGWHPSGGSRPRRDDDSVLAPVIPLFGGAAGEGGDRLAATPPQQAPGDIPSDRPAAGQSPDVEEKAVEFGPRSTPAVFTTLRALISTDDDHAAEHGERQTRAVPSDDDRPIDEVRGRAEAMLLRKLRTRSLSLSEARGVLRAVEGADNDLVAELIDHFVDIGYLDDVALAEQVAMTAVERKGQGRRAVVQSLMGRGIPRDVIDGVVAELPDDDEERALEFARSRAGAVGGRDRDASLRRLAGQLARRGYPSSVALNAARRALDEVSGGGSRSFGAPSSGVRFTPDE